MAPYYRVSGARFDLVLYTLAQSKKETALNPQATLLKAFCPVLPMQVDKNMVSHTFSLEAFMV
jgi:hypothetical protein